MPSRTCNPAETNTPAFPHPPANKTHHKSGRTFATGESFFIAIFFYFSQKPTGMPERRRQNSIRHRFR
ncbi:MAG: hypothetical protein BHW58_08925 [Azospirillum sp. 51_20]|jgi:hypothetical protein|nr:MAG: hypothetical protein BHW58_08925 [Azospirillum sp. 51_20]